MALPNPARLAALLALLVAGGPTIAATVVLQDAVFCAQFNGSCPSGGGTTTPPAAAVGSAQVSLGGIPVTVGYAAEAGLLPVVGPVASAGFGWTSATPAEGDHAIDALLALPLNTPIDVSLFASAATRDEPSQAGIPSTGRNASAFIDPQFIPEDPLVEVILSPNLTPVPLPATGWLLLGGLFILARRVRIH